MTLNPRIQYILISKIIIYFTLIFEQSLSLYGLRTVCLCVCVAALLQDRRTVGS